MPSTDTRQLIVERLEALRPEHLALTDDSAAHRGHAGNTGGGHYSVEITGACFNGIGRLERQRMVKELLADLFPDRIHALSVRAMAPDEYKLYIK